ncbi:MAG: ceramidase domain-containing protein [Bacteroidota bacterium]|nr:ceramidase domain-containing protein [Bacteroidota bacterium]
MKKETIGYFILISLALTAITGICFSPPIQQDEDYHLFSDKDELLGVSNFWNVISNLPFLIIGALGILKLKHLKKSHAQYVLFFSSICFVGIGSAYYHLNPTTETLVWDRLPMSLAFMTLFSLIISEFIHEKAGKLLLAPLLLLGILSIAVWLIFNDLRFYALVQFYPMLAIPAILIHFKSDNTTGKAYWLLLLAYILAKLMEHFDQEVHTQLKVISGHSLKHFTAAIGVYAITRNIIKQPEGVIKQVTGSALKS